MPRTKKQTKEEKEEKAAVKKTVKVTSFYQAVGRRKEATARVRLYVTSSGGEINISGKVIKSGDILINSRPAAQYFAGEVYKKNYLEPFRTTNTVGRFAVSSIIVGGGIAGQVGAFIHGVSKALEKVDHDKFRPILKKQGFLSRDSRTKERRKAGFAQKARAKKQSPKR